MGAYTSTPQSLDLDTLILRCRAESRQPYPVSRLAQPTSCYELLRRAVEEGLSEAWDAIYQQYRRLMLHWAGPTRPDADALVDRAFEKFWHSCPRESFSRRFPDLRHALGYLRQCVVTACQDARRQEQRLVLRDGDALEMVDPALPTVESAALESVTGQEWHVLIQDRLKDERERRVVALTYHNGLTPLQIVGRHPDEFPSVHEVRRIKERILKRLRGDAVLKALWDE